MSCQEDHQKTAACRTAAHKRCMQDSRASAVHQGCRSTSYGLYLTHQQFCHLVTSPPSPHPMYHRPT
jgi:hypothetical protein